MTNTSSESVVRWVRCLDCGWTQRNECDTEDQAMHLTTGDARLHRGLGDDSCEPVVVMDDYGLELERYYSVPGTERRNVCQNCRAALDGETVSCPHCGYIPEEARA